MALGAPPTPAAAFAPAATFAPIAPGFGAPPARASVFRAPVVLNGQFMQ